MSPLTALALQPSASRPESGKQDNPPPLSSGSELCQHLGWAAWAGQAIFFFLFLLLLLLLALLLDSACCALCKTVCGAA